jgi:hypothetical protein
MKFNIKNDSNLNLSEIKPFLESFLPFAQKKMGFDAAPTISFISDTKNAKKPLGKTAFYDPNTFSVSVYTDQRHPKDIMRSLSHELVHHTQNCRGDFDVKPEMGEGYFQNDSYMREMEREAYELGNMCFRMWEETYKKELQESIYYTKGDNSKMSYKNWRNQEVNGRLMESWGYNVTPTEILTETVKAQEQELDEAHCGGVHEDAEELEEEAKPDFLDLDKDGDKEESMKSAAEDTEEEVDEALIRKTIREAITKALKTRSNKED